MNKKQLQTFKEQDECIGIGSSVKETVKKWDNDGKIKPHFSIVPVLYLAVDAEKYNVELTDKTYKEYEEAYEEAYE